MRSESRSASRAGRWSPPASPKRTSRTCARSSSRAAGTTSRPRTGRSPSTSARSRSSGSIPASTGSASRLRLATDAPAAPARRSRRRDAGGGPLVAQEPLRLPLRPALLGRSPAPDHHPRAPARGAAPEPGERLLEIGVGTGYYSCELAEWVGAERHAGALRPAAGVPRPRDAGRRRARPRQPGPDPGRRDRPPLRGRLGRRRRSSPPSSARSPTPPPPCARSAAS